MATSRPYKLYRPAAPLDRRRPASRVGVGTATASVRAAISAEVEDEEAGARNGEETPPAEPATALGALGGRRIWWRALRWALGLAAVLAVGYLGWLGYSIYRFEQRVFKPLPTLTPVLSQQAIAPTVESRPLDSSSGSGSASLATPTATAYPLVALPEGRINILILGTDKRPNDVDHYPRSDTMILLNLDTTNKRVRVMSMPRDLVVEIPGYGESKLNSAYLYGEYYDLPGGGQALAVQTVSQLFNVPIDYYVAINFDGFRKVIDTVGGIEVDVPYELDDYHYPSDDEGDPFGELHVHFDAGLQHMDGKTALRYARTRHADNDFMRNKRQLQVILATRRSALSFNLIPTLPNLIDHLAGTVETNIPFKQQLALAQLGYDLEASNILTSTIDRDMIVPTILPDGSEGLELDWKAAKPVIEDFFGRPVAKERLTGSKAAKSKARTATPTVKRATRTPTRAPRVVRRATRTPSIARTRTATPLPDEPLLTKTPTQESATPEIEGPGDVELELAPPLSP